MEVPRLSGNPATTDLMFQALRLAAAGAPALLCLCSEAPAKFIPNPDFAQGDAEKGKQIRQRVGVCVNRHGWAGDGQSGRNPLSHAAGANPRETERDSQGLYDAIRCGVPGAQMPYHDNVPYRDDRCFGMLLADFDDGR
jgi:hypothetical protein